MNNNVQEVSFQDCLTIHSPTSACGPMQQLQGSAECNVLANSYVRYYTEGRILLSTWLAHTYSSVQYWSKFPFIVFSYTYLCCHSTRFLQLYKHNVILNSLCRKDCTKRNRLQHGRQVQHPRATCRQRGMAQKHPIPNSSHGKYQNIHSQ